MGAGARPRPPGPLAAAAAAGLADVAGAEVLAIPASHVVQRVSAAGRSVVVKVPGEEALAAGRTLAAEAFAYRLSTWRAGLASVMPDVLLVDERRQVVVLAAAEDRTSGRDLLARGELPEPRAAAALGRSLARLHRDTTGLPIPFRASDGVLELTSVPTPEILLDRARALALAVAADDVLGPALTRARRAWRPDCLVHGDVKWDNCLVEQAVDGPHVVLIDWELSGLGDPAWDVAAALAGSFALERSLGVPGDDERRALATAYWAQDGTADPTRVAVLCPPRLVQLALECAESGADLEASALLEAARALVREEQALRTTMAQWADSSRPASAAS